MIKNKNILITGGAGFVGSHLCEALNDNNNKLFVLDNYFTGSKKNHVRGVKYIKGETKDIFKYFHKIDTMDIIFHLGEYSRVEQSFADIEKVIKFNILSFFEVVRLCQHFGAKLIYCGSSTKFAKYDAADSVSPYAWSKKNNTEFLNNFAKLLKIRYAITYFYNVYGEREISDGKYATVVAKFLRLKKSNQKYLTITKPGTQRRNFTHVDDIISGLILVAKKGQGDGYGIASNDSLSIYDLAKLLKMPYKLQKKKRGNRLNGEVNTIKTKKLGWKPRIKINEYIKRHIENN